MVQRFGWWFAAAMVGAALAAGGGCSGEDEPTAPGNGGATTGVVGGGGTTGAGGQGAAGAHDAGSDAPYEAGTLCTDGEPTPSSYASLLFDVVGFGAAATGGVDGCLYHVTTLDDSGPGSLRAALESDEPLWIVFDLSGEIPLPTFIDVRSNKTIDGRGQQVQLSGAGLAIEDDTHNVIVENLVFAGGQVDDAITVYGGAHTIWVDHCSFDTYADGQIDITEASTDVTVSWCVFRNHGLVMLIGASVQSTGDEVIRVTLHHNWFDSTDERQPRLRYGRVHAYNNLLVGWLYYGMGSSQRGQLASEANIFDAADNKQAIVTQVGSDPELGRVRSEGELLLNGATVETNEPSAVFDPAAAYGYNAAAADAALRSQIESGAGWRNVPLPE